MMETLAKKQSHINYEKEDVFDDNRDVFLLGSAPLSRHPAVHGPPSPALVLGSKRLLGVEEVWIRAVNMAS